MKPLEVLMRMTSDLSLEKASESRKFRFDGRASIWTVRMSERERRVSRLTGWALWRFGHSMGLMSW